MLDIRKFIALVGAGGLLLTAMVRRALTALQVKVRQPLGYSDSRCFN
jgi:hypothetical protein